MTLEGAKVHAVAEVMPYSGGLKRNIVQCLEDFDIPLYLSTTVVDIHGQERLEGVTLARVDENRRPIPGTERDIPCDTLLLSVGLLPENELSQQAGVRLDAVTGGPEVGDDLSTSIPVCLPAATCCMSTIWWTLCPRRRHGQEKTLPGTCWSSGGSGKPSA